MAEKQSDTSRWATEASFEPYWLERNRILATHIPAGSSVLEFGAGMRELEKLLPARCRYTPSDLVDRGPGTLVCDLNRRPLPALPAHDLMVMSGVMEYVHDPADLLVQLRPVAPRLLLSYAAWDEQQSSLAKRRELGFVNDFSAEAFFNLLTATGWRSETCGQWGGQLLLRCDRNDD